MNDMAVRAWLGTKCQCGKMKRERESFCFDCWNALDGVSARSRLNYKFGSEFTTAYLACCEYLKQKAVKK
jgi:hypothetical protein